MGRAREPMPVKLIVSMFGGNHAVLRTAMNALSIRFGDIDYESELLPFDQTSYYEKEFGSSLQRIIVSFATLMMPDGLAEVKVATNHLELAGAVDGKRRVNLDAGYVSLSKLVLATTKDYSHRIYLASGVYAEVTLRYQGGHFQPWPWTYPDYASPRYLEIFAGIRRRYMAQLATRGNRLETTEP